MSSHTCIIYLIHVICHHILIHLLCLSCCLQMSKRPLALLASSCHMVSCMASMMHIIASYTMMTLTITIITPTIPSPLARMNGGHHGDNGNGVFAVSTGTSTCLQADSRCTFITDCCAGLSCQVFTMLNDCHTMAYNAL